MGRGRKNLKRAVEEGNLILQPGQSIMQVVSLRGSNLIEVMDAKGEKSLALFPAKFQKSMWIKRGSFVVVDESGREQALESGSKVACIVSQVLFHEQVRRLRKSPEWNRGFTHEMCDPSFHCERYWDTTNTVHFLSGEIVITPQELTMLVANWIGLLWTSPNHLESFSKSCGIRGQKPSDHKPMINPVGIFQNLPQSKMEKKQAQVTTTAFPHLKLT